VNSTYQNSFREYHTVPTVPKLNRNIAKRGKIDTPTCKYMTAHFRGLAQTLQKNV